MTYVRIVSKSKITGRWMEETKEFHTKEATLRFLYAMKSKGIIIDSWACDDPLDNDWLNKRFKP